MRNRLTQVNLPGAPAPAPVKLAYDWSNRLVTKTVGTAVTRFGYDGAEAVHQVLGTVKTNYTYGPGLDEVLAQEQGTTTLYLLRDGLNSTVAATSTTGAVVERYAYDAYGQVQVLNAARQPVTTAPQTPWLFTGRYYHADAKLYDFRNRAYNQRIGRFMQADPIGFAGGDVNLYRYSDNNPVNRFDPDGTTTTGPVGPWPGGGTGTGGGSCPAGKGNRWACHATCNVHPAEAGASCPDRVEGDGYGPSRPIAWSNAQENANSKLAGYPGCQKKHCHGPCWQQ